MSVKMNIYFLAFVSVYITLARVVMTNRNPKQTQNTIFENAADINELIGFPNGFYEKYGKPNPFIIYKSFSDKHFTDNVLQNLYDENNMNDIFFCYKEYYGKAYKAVDVTKRKSILRNKIEYIFNHNNNLARLGKSNYTLGLNQFSDLTREEIAQENSCLFNDNINVRQEQSSTRKSKASTLDGAHRMPLTKDWSTFDTPVKNQGGCGACWAFATIAVIENHLIKNGYITNIDLSEQELIDCSRSYGTNGCDGAWLHQAFNYAKDRFISHEVYYTYTGKNGVCRRNQWWNGKISSLHMTGYVSVQPVSEDGIQNTIANVGPVVTGLSVNDDFHDYRSGVFDNANCKYSEDWHAVAIIGYNWEGIWPFTKDYWIIKNSWDDTWGENGYMKLGRGNNVCGIGTHDSYYPQIITNQKKSCTHDDLRINGMCGIEDIIRQIEYNMSMIFNEMEKLIPIGYIYFQLPNQAEPRTLWPNTEWSDISTSYSGHFFRVVGGNSVPFGQRQTDAFQGHWHNFVRQWQSVLKGAEPFDGSWNQPFFGPNTASSSSAVRTPVTDGFHGIPRVAVETRPMNYAYGFVRSNIIYMIVY